MNNTPLVSVLIRTKDREALLREALDSVLAQTWPAIEVIIVNDGGENFSSAVLPGDASNIRWLDNTGEHGRSHAANLAMENATGDFCLFLDDDDLIDPDHLQHLVTALQENDGAVAVYSAVRVMTDGVIESEPSFNYAFDPVRLMIENYIPIHAMLFRRALIDAGFRFDPAFDRFEDWDFWLQAAEHNSFLFVNRCTATYRVNSASGFGAKDDTGEDLDQYRSALYRKWLPRWPDNKVLELINRSREFPRVAVLQKSTDELKAHVKRLESVLLERHEKLREKIAELEKTQVELHDTWERVNEHCDRANEYLEMMRSMHQQIQDLYSSSSWKITRPLRALVRLITQWREHGFFSMFSLIRSRMDDNEQEVEVETPLPEENIHPIPDAYTPLAFPEYDNPSISIVIPCFNQHLYTYHCLRSILDHVDDEAVEVIVVDDESTDATAAMLADISGIRVIRNEQNCGFIKTCNRGAEAARGEFLVLLNNDTEVTKGWLQALRSTFAEFPDAGMVGAKLLFANDTLQEAGGIVWRDGSAWNYGRGDDPHKPEYSYCRRVDYCSGACLMLRREDFNALNGFDEHYLPAYYEDTDLAFRIREMGKQVYYQPVAVVYHFEGVTSGTDLEQGLKKYQVTNKDKFYDRWKKTLVNHRQNGNLPNLEKDRSISQRILVIDARTLMPDQDSGSLRMFNILKILRNMGHKVTFVPSNLRFDPHYTPLLQAVGIECEYKPYTRTIEEFLEDQGSQFNTVILSRADYADRYIGIVKQHCVSAKILFDTVDLHFLREQREAELSGREEDLNAAALRKLQELDIARKSDVTLVVSPVELEMFRQEAPDVQVSLLSNIHTTYDTANSFSERKDILFIGCYEHPPNVDAMEFFLDEVFPLVLEKNPGIRLLIVGEHLPDHLAARANDNIVVTGFVPDIQPLFDNIRLSIAPLRFGAGVKGKINTSLSYGVPMVATSIAAEGMGLVHEQDILIADQPKDFADAIVRLYEDEDLWQALSVAGKHNIEDHFSFALAEKQLRAVLPD